jgi:molybdopterin synthase sulfur carrier subunit
MKVNVRFFSSLREQLGFSVYVHETGSETVSQLRSELMGLNPLFAEVLAHGKAIRMALNQEVCQDTALLSEGCEIAFFPPVTGG